jgi:hypothetical protein
MQRARLAKLVASAALLCAVALLLVATSNSHDGTVSLLSSSLLASSSDVRMEIKRTVSADKEYIVSFNPALPTGAVEAAAARLNSLEWFSFGLVKAVVVSGADVAEVVALLKSSKLPTGEVINDFVIAVEENSKYGVISFAFTRKNSTRSPARTPPPSP